MKYGKWHLREIIIHKFRCGRVLLRKRRLVIAKVCTKISQALRYLSTFLIIPWMHFISDKADVLDRHGYLFSPGHYDDVIMTMLASQITSLTVVYSIVYSGVNQRKHQSSASLAFVREIHRGPVNFPHKWPVTRKIFPFDDVIMSRVAMEINGAKGNTVGFFCYSTTIL